MNESGGGVSHSSKMHENSPCLLPLTPGTTVRSGRSSPLPNLVGIALVWVVVPGGFSQEIQRIFLPADATDVAILRVYPSSTESTTAAPQRIERRLEEYGRASNRLIYKRIPSIAVVIQYRSPSQMITRPVIRGGLEENAASAVRQRTAHFTKNLTSRAFKLVPKGRISSTVAVEDSSQCWERSPGGTDFQFRYGCRGNSTRAKVEMLAFDLFQN